MDETAALWSFEDWVVYLFATPRPVAGWYDAYICAGMAPTSVVDYITRLFEDAGSLMAPYSNDQVSAGLETLNSSGYSDAMGCLIHEQVPRAARDRCILSIYGLFEQVFAPRCGSNLSYRDQGAYDTLSITCYMWWDVCTYFDPLCLDVMRRTLELASDACQESALHGLGHSREVFPDVVAQIVDAYLASPRERRPELVSYALQARAGCVM